MTGTYQDFRDALRAFESGWDRDRYEAGDIADWQLDEWAGGPVTDFYSQYSSWGDLTDAEWDAMSYRSMNSLGFVGYQFGEALLIDLGYYDDDFYYGNGAASNTWDGTWTGKNGVDSLDEFMTADAQEVAIQEAFGMNLQIIQEGLANVGKSLDDYVGTVGSYEQNGATVSVELTLSGILAAAHLRGAYGTLDLLLSDAVSTDENGTSILQYIDQFGGYETPASDTIISFYEDRLTGDEGPGVPGDGDNGSGDMVSEGSGPYGEADVDAQTADVVITWNWGVHATVSDFDPTADTIFVDWIGASDLEITETNAGVIFALPGNEQSTTLADVTLDELSLANFTILDATAADEISSLIGENDSTPSTDTMLVSTADSMTMGSDDVSADDVFAFGTTAPAPSETHTLAGDRAVDPLGGEDFISKSEEQHTADLPHFVDNVMGNHAFPGDSNSDQILPSDPDFII